MCANLNSLYAVKSLIISPTFYNYKQTKQITYDSNNINSISRYSNCIRLHVYLQTNKRLIWNRI